MPETLTHKSDSDTSTRVVTDATNAATLASILSVDPLLSLAAIQSIIAQVAAALAQAHAANVVHGALSTRSILINLDGDAIVANLGADPPRAYAAARDAAENPATLAYASPEVVRGERATPSSDQYSLGAIAYELLAGRRPFDGTPAKVRRAQLGKRPEPIGTLHLVHPDAWSAAVMKMLAKQPSERFASIADAVKAITPPIGGPDQGFRRTLGWLAQQQIPGASPIRATTPVGGLAPVGPTAPVAPISPVAHTQAPVAPVAPVAPAEPARAPLALTRPRAAPAAPARAPHAALAVDRGGAMDVSVDALFSPSVMDELRASHSRPAHLFEEPRIARRRHLINGGIASLIVILIAGAAWTGRLPSLTRTQFSNMLARIEQRMPVDPLPPQMTTATAPPAPATAGASRPLAPSSIDRDASRAAPRAAARDVPREAPRETPRQTPRTAAPAAPRSDAQAVTVPIAPTITITLPDPAPAPVDDRQPQHPPAIFSGGPPGPSPTAAAPPAPPTPAVTQPLTAAQADGAARTLIDQLRRGDLRAVSSTAASSGIDADFLAWLRARSGEFQVGAPGTARVAPLPDGSAQVTYSVPVSWTHASGARRTRTAVMIATVRPAPSGAKLASWALAEPFVP